MAMYRTDFVELAKAVRDAGTKIGSTEHQLTVASVLADHCEKRYESFDREMFIAYAMAPVIPGVE